MQLIHLPPDPRPRIPEIYLVPQFPPPHLAGPQRIERTRYDRRRGFLVVEYAERGHRDDQDKDWEGPEPDAPGLGDRREGAVGAAGHEGPGAGLWGCYEGAVDDIREKGGVAIGSSRAPEKGEQLWRGSRLHVIVTALW